MSSPLRNETAIACYNLICLFMLIDNLGGLGNCRLLGSFPVHLFHMNGSRLSLTTLFFRKLNAYWCNRLSRLYAVLACLKF